MDRQRYRDDRRQSSHSSHRRGYQEERRGPRYDDDNYDEYDDGQYYERSPNKRRRRDDYDSRSDYHDDQYDKRYDMETQYYTRKSQQFDDDDWIDDRRGGHDSYHRDEDYDDSRHRHGERRRSYDNHGSRREPEGFQRRGIYRDEPMSRRGRGSYERRDNIQRRDDYKWQGDYQRRGRGRGSYQHRRDDSYHPRPYRRRHYEHHDRNRDDPSSSEWSGIEDEEEDEEEEKVETTKDAEGDEKMDENKVSSTLTEEVSPPTEEDISKMEKNNLDDLASSILLILFENLDGSCTLNGLRLELIMKDVAVFNSSTNLKEFLLKYKSVFLVTTLSEEADTDVKEEPAEASMEEVKEEEKVEEKVAEKVEEEGEKEEDKKEAEEAVKEEKTEASKEQEEEKMEDKEEPGSSTPDMDTDKPKPETEEEVKKPKEEEGAGEAAEETADDKDDHLNVTATPTLRLCLSHSTKASSCKGKCKSLHVCRYFVLSKCDIVDTGKRCLFGHDMDSKYNKYILRKSLLHKFPPRLAQKVLLNLKYRNRTTLPVVCRFYNTFWGCKNSRNNSCPFLHICEDYILGFCKSEDKKCRFRHDISHSQPAAILERYGMSTSEKNPKDEILKALKRSMMMSKRGAASHSRLPPRAQSVVSGEGEAEKEDDDVEMETKLKWQCRTTQQRGSAWLDIDESSKIEDKYAVYMKARKYTFTMAERESEINFDRMSGHTTGGLHLEFRRVSEKVPKKAPETSNTEPPAKTST
ncbi:sarcoplasmic reticulum histidine-rich calcium-binding protein-like [Haliotis rufescens]|uniref:sarcoplasmic reticulum histidine-rich calcium-binding protein-like n=1 Tax=Haliotis rufescens TaxID=6454 RepID=UPI00201F61E4|nr:sarcoplasmic reticulum histidine-rich calcium-binding protein-like [Haliotis rufescens]XP_046379826.2 sarcoplasmic reticulum histidine-rich calcium-binding protein-like [Haliotis rufescens]